MAVTKGTDSEWRLLPATDQVEPVLLLGDVERSAHGRYLLSMADMLTRSARCDRRTDTHIFLRVFGVPGLRMLRTGGMRGVVDLLEFRHRNVRVDRGCL